jgi:DNA/RNA-binding domain of Phe-tRNA-synthetase-like protein
MKKLQYTVASEIFEVFPTFKRGVVVCSNVRNIGDCELDFSALPGKLNITADNITESAPVSAWRKAFRIMGIDPTKDRVSFEGLTRRLLNNNSIRRINPVVDLGNYFSVLHQCPVGAHPVTTDATVIHLKMAVGNEIFSALGSSQIETVSQNEIILTDETNILTRRFCWRQGTSSLVTEVTSDLFVNFDFICKLGNEEIANIMTSFESELANISLTAKTQSFILSNGSGSQECFF